jgi:hypothetical protein
MKTLLAAMAFASVVSTVRASLHKLTQATQNAGYPYNARK